MQERNVISGTMATFLAPFVDGWRQLFIWGVVAAVLIIADLRFGMAAARKRGEKIRGSRAVRRTINKAVDYICWVSIAWVLGGSFGQIFNIPAIPAIVMLGVCAIELSSITSNYFEYRGIHKKFNVTKWLSLVFRRPELQECVEDEENKDNNGNS